MGAHMGWLLVRKNPDVLREGNKIDMSDLRADPVVMFQHRHYWTLSLPICIVIPTLIPVYFWGEALWTSYVVQVLRYAISLHSTWLVNSAAHMWGDRPYDEHVNPAVGSQRDHLLHRLDGMVWTGLGQAVGEQRGS